MQQDSKGQMGVQKCDSRRGRMPLNVKHSTHECCTQKCAKCAKALGVRCWHFCHVFRFFSGIPVDICRFCRGFCLHAFKEALTNQGGFKNSWPGKVAHVPLEVLSLQLHASQCSQKRPSWASSVAAALTSSAASSSTGSSASRCGCHICHEL